MKHNDVKDHYEGQATRNSREGKGRYDLISPIALRRLAIVFEDGAKGHGDRNWEQGIPLSRFMDSAMRHLLQYMQGLEDEDHLAQAEWNIHCAIHTEHQAKDGELPRELLDLPMYGQHEVTVCACDVNARNKESDDKVEIGEWHNPEGGNPMMPKPSLRNYPVEPLFKDEVDLIAQEQDFHKELNHE